MTKPFHPYLILLLFISCHGFYPCLASADNPVFQKDPSGNRSLLNGRIWRNQYSQASGDQFFLSDTFLRGSVIFNGRRFTDIDLQYDIADDELIYRTESYPVIILNKEMVDSFSLICGDRKYFVINTGTDTSGLLNGYVNVLYDGPSSLYVKYTKKILPLALDGRYDLFYQGHAMFLRKGTEIVAIPGKKYLIKLLEDKKKEIRNYIRSQRLKLTRKNPDTFVPVLKYYDSIGK